MNVKEINPDKLNDQSQHSEYHQRNLRNIEHNILKFAGRFDGYYMRPIEDLIELSRLSLLRKRSSSTIIEVVRNTVYQHLPLLSLRMFHPVVDNIDNQRDEIDQYESSGSPNNTE